jgi:hypothetical protein
VTDRRAARSEGENRRKKKHTDQEENRSEEGSIQLRSEEGTPRQKKVHNEFTTRIQEAASAKLFPVIVSVWL